MATFFKQTANINSYNINIFDEVNNDITLWFHPSVFRKEPHHLDLLHLNIDSRITLFGNTNNTIIVTYTNNLNEIITHDVTVDYNKNIKTDHDLASQIAQGLNNQVYDNYDIEFSCIAMNYENIIDNIQIEQEAYTATYTILASNFCTLDFSHKDSIGPLIGFNYGFYDTLTPILGITGVHVRSILRYNYIQAYNPSGKTQFELPDPLPDPIPNPHLLDYVCDDITTNPCSSHECCSHHKGSHHGPINPGSHRCCSHKGGSHHAHSYKSWHFCNTGHAGHRSSQSSNHSINSHNSESSHGTKVTTHGSKKGGSKSSKGTQHSKKTNYVHHTDHDDTNPECGYWKRHAGSHKCCSHRSKSFKGSHHGPLSHKHCSHYGGSHHSHSWKSLNGKHHPGSHKHCSHYTGSSRGSHHGPKNPNSHRCCSHHYGSHHGCNTVPGHHHCSHYGGSHHNTASHKCCSHHDGPHQQDPIDRHHCCSHHGGSHHSKLSHKHCSHYGGSHHGPVNPGSHHCCSHHGGSHHSAKSHKHCSHYGGKSRGSHHGKHKRGSRKKKKHHDKHRGKQHFKSKKHKHKHLKNHGHHAPPWNEFPTNFADCCFTCLNRKTGTDNIDPIIEPDFNLDCETPIIDPVYINYDDRNCKMLLFDSNNNLIPNLTHPGLDTTISLKHTYDTAVYYDNIYKLLRDLEIELNRYITKFKPYAFFECIYNYKDNVVTIINKTGAKFGIGFDFLIDANIVSTGSLHKVLGFEQKKYLGLTSIVSTKKPLMYEYIYGGDSIYILSDLLKDGNPDINVFSLGNGQVPDVNNILYSVPMKDALDFHPQANDKDYSVELFQSKLTYFGDQVLQLYENERIPVNFYIRLKSGRHIQMIAPYTMNMNIEYR